MFKFKTLKIFSLAVCLLLFTTAGCSITPPELTTVVQERDKTIAEILILPKVDYIQTFRSDWGNAEDGGTCYYARGYLVLATQQLLSGQAESHTSTQHCNGQGDMGLMIVTVIQL